MGAGPVAPYGGPLVDLVVGPERAAELKRQSLEWPGWDLTPRQLCDLELLATGGFSPLRGFLGRADYESVLSSMRLADGTLWPVPVTLDLPEALAARLAPGGVLALRDPEGVLLAALAVEETWRPDKDAEALAVFGTTDATHPGVAALRASAPVYVSGRLEVLTLPLHYDFRPLRHTPAQLREQFSEHGWDRVVAFPTRDPVHRPHLELTLRAAREAGAGLLIHAVVGTTGPGEVDRYTRVRCCRAVLPHYPEGSAMLSMLPMAPRLAGRREAVWQAIVARNHGASHVLVDGDPAGPGQELVRRHEQELGVTLAPPREMVYLADRGEYVPDDEVPAGAPVLSLPAAERRRLLAAGEPLPDWFTLPAVAEELRRSYPPRSEQGFTVFFTGLSGSGKSTIANVLLAKLLERGGRRVTLLDGDLVRRHLSSELGFSRPHRDLNVRRIGYVAAQITWNGGAAVCAPIAPYDATRRDVREMVAAGGGFVLVHVATPLEVCERRDRKGLYARARAGIIPEFTGISDPYEEPTDAEITIDTMREPAEDSAERVLGWLQGEGYLRDGS